jgi:hypothetical protein
MVGKNKMVDWKQAVVTWKTNKKSEESQKSKRIDVEALIKKRDRGEL